METIRDETMLGTTPPKFGLIMDGLHGDWLRRRRWTLHSQRGSMLLSIMVEKA